MKNIRTIIVGWGVSDKEKNGKRAIQVNQGEKRRYLIEYLLGEQKRMQRVEIPVDAQGQRNLLSPVAYPYLCWNPASSENA